MKKLIFILLTMLFITSCGYAPMDNSEPIIITKIEKCNEIYSYYYGYGNYKLSKTLTESDFKFRDTIGKFQIGDTVNFYKK